MYSSKVNKKAGVRSDQIVKLSGFYSKQYYPEKMRRIKFYDEDQQRSFVFLTNNFTLKAKNIAALYKYRWKVELFFKWIKQHLKIKSFWGQNENAVKSQIWVAISTYVIVAIAKRKLKISNSLYEILQYISIAPFEKTSLTETFITGNLKESTQISLNQLEIF